MRMGGLHEIVYLEYTWCKYLLVWKEDGARVWDNNNIMDALVGT